MVTWLHWKMFNLATHKNDITNDHDVPLITRESSMHTYLFNPNCFPQYIVHVLSLLKLCNTIQCFPCYSYGLSFKFWQNGDLFCTKYIYTLYKNKPEWLYKQKFCLTKMLTSQEASIHAVHLTIQGFVMKYCPDAQQQIHTYLVMQYSEISFTR